MRVKLSLPILLILLLGACTRISGPLESTSPRERTITVIADGETRTWSSSAATVSEALAEAQIHLGALDRVEPGEYLALEEGMVITVVRIIEQFQSTEVEILFGQQIIQNEGLPEGDRRLLQAGQPGLEEIVYRIEYHDGAEVDRRMVRRTVLEPALDEIVMIGSQGTISPVPVPGTLGYISGGNGVVMRVSSSNRDPIVTSGDLDARVFALSPDGRRLLYTRSIPLSTTMTGTVPAFNSLWVINTARLSGPIVAESLGVENILWANWSPDGEQIAYSTGDPISQPPGWEANNDLWMGEWDSEGGFGTEQLLESSSGGVYGWWGADYAWSPNSRYLAYGQADEVGVIDLETGRRSSLAQFDVFHTYADWVWTARPTWSPDSNYVAAVVHGPPTGPEAAEDSQIFDLWAWQVEGLLEAPLASRIGMWGYPAWSPGREVGGEQASQIAFLRSTKPLESAFALYQLWVMDRDGSEMRLLFPLEGESGLQPQPVAWSPEADQIALINRGDLYLVNILDGSARPLTGDGINSHPTWVARGITEDYEIKQEIEPDFDPLDRPVE